VAAVACLQVGEVVIGGVGEEHLVAPPLGIEEGEVGTGMRLLPPADGPGTSRPGGKIKQIGQLGDSCPAAQSAVLVDGLHPRVGGDVQDGQLYVLGDVEADRVLDAVPAQRVQEVMGAAC